MTATAALLRWVVRLARREWRQHLLVTALVSFGITGAVVVVVAVSQLADPPERWTAGAPSMLQGFADDLGAHETGATDSGATTGDGAGDDRAALLAGVESVVGRHPDVELVLVGSPGPEGVTLIAQDPAGPLGRPWLDLRAGAWPAAGQVTLSTAAADRLGRQAGGAPVVPGDTVTVGGRSRLVAGVFDNPTDLEAVTGLAPRSELGQWQEIKVLLPSVGHPAAAELAAIRIDGDRVLFEQSPVGTAQGDIVMAYLLATVLLIQVAVLASAGFTVLAERRSRQLGLLAAIGASPARIGSVLRLTGLVVGAVGGLIGLAAGLAVSAALAPSLQRLSGHRVTATDVPWSYVAPLLPLAVATAVAGAWWPARRVQRISALDAIAARRARAGGVVRSVVVGVALVVAGTGAMIVGAPKNNPLLVVVGVVGVAVGGLLLAPGAITLLGAVGGPGPVPVRLAWRDLARNRSRSAAAVGAATVALALPFGISSFVASLGSTWQPNVPSHAALIAGPITRQGMPLVDQAESEAAELAATVPGARLVPLSLPVDRASTGELGPGGGFYPFQVQTLRSSGPGWGLTTAVATPELLALMDIDPPAPDVDVIVAGSIRLALDPSVTVQRVGLRPSMFPEVLLVHELPGMSFADTVVLDRFLVADHPLTAEERHRLESVGGSVGSATGPSFDRTRVILTESTPPFVAIRSSALAIGALFGLAAVAVAVALIRAEARPDGVVLTAVGARPRTARLIGAVSAGGLGLAAGAIAVPCTLLLLLGVYLNPDEEFRFTVPWAELAVVLVVVPLVAAAAGWLLTDTRTTRRVA